MSLEKREFSIEEICEASELLETFEYDGDAAKQWLRNEAIKSGEPSRLVDIACDLIDTVIKLRKGV